MLTLREEIAEELGQELGQFAVSVRRELREARDLALAEMRAAVAELRLAVNERLATVRDGRDGLDGKDGSEGRDGADGAVGAPGAPGEPGPAGADARSFDIRGTWAEAEEYRALDVVALNGASFVARRDAPGACPGEGWQLIAGQGKRGHQGDQGPPGPKGDDGPEGPAGMPVVALAVDAEGLLTLTNGDGSTVNCDLYPLLAKAR
jgi:hypothetical protein